MAGFAVSEKRSSAQSFTSSSASPVLKILVIEDDPICQRVVQLMLQHMGHKVKLVATGKHALEIYPLYDLIISDLGLPDIDGMSICRTIRNHNLSQQVPIIALTANYQSKTRCLNVGFSDFIAKPVEYKVLERTINKYVTACAIS